jgi:hypothetical protein
MSLSRRLIEQLVAEVVNLDCTEITTAKKESLIGLCNQLFLEQVTSVDNSSAKSSITNKIDQYYNVLSVKGRENET